MTEKLIYRPEDLAEALNVSRSTIVRMEKRGELPPRRKISAGTRGWARATIISWLESRPKVNGDEEE